MEKYKITTKLGIEVASIWIWKLNMVNKIGMIILVPYLNENIRDLYPIAKDNSEIINELLNRANFNDCNIKNI